MARARYIHPRIQDSPSVHKLGPAGSFFWVSMVLQADDEGRLRDAPDVLRSTAFPYPHSNVSQKRARKWLEIMAEENMILRYTAANGCQYIQLLNFKSYNNPSHKSVSKIPPPPAENSGGNSGKNSGGNSEKFPSQMGRVGLGVAGAPGPKATTPSTPLSEPPTSPAGERSGAAPVGGTPAAPASAPVDEYDEWLKTATPEDIAAQRERVAEMVRRVAR